MKYLSLFSGIEAATVAWHPLGWEPVAFAEVDKNASRVLAHHYPNVPNLGDITKITAAQIAALGQIDLVVGGFPCQDLSVAGKRKGLNNSDGSVTRSGLFFDAMRLVRLAKPKWVVIENVPGLYSSKGGRDFASVVGEILGIEFDVPKDRWKNTGVAVSKTGRVEWSTLDAQWFGLAQRRKRVFFVGYFGDWASCAPVLLERESLSGHSAPRREKRQGAPETALRGVDGRGDIADARQKDGINGASASNATTSDFDQNVQINHTERVGRNAVMFEGLSKSEILRTMANQSGPEIRLARGIEIGPSGGGFTDVNPTLDARAKDGPIRNQLAGAVQHSAEVAPTLNAHFGSKQGLEDQHIRGGQDSSLPLTAMCLNAGAMGRRDAESETLIPTHGADFDVAETLASNGDGHTRFRDEKGLVAHSLRAEGFDASEDGTGRGISIIAIQDSVTPKFQNDLAFTLTQPSPSGGGHPQAVAIQNATRGQDQNGLGIGGDVMFTLDQASQHGVALNIYGGNKRPDRPEGEFYVRDDEGVSKTLDSSSGLNPTSAQGGTAILNNWAVRRLTPEECETLQGFPRGYTDIKHGGKPTPDGSRYKQLGNSMAVNVMCWIGQRIELVENLK